MRIILAYHQSNLRDAISNCLLSTCGSTGYHSFSSGIKDAATLYYRLLGNLFLGNQMWKRWLHPDRWTPVISAYYGTVDEHEDKHINLKFNDVIVHTGIHFLNGFSIMYTGEWSEIYFPGSDRFPWYWFVFFLKWRVAARRSACVWWLH